MSKCGSGESCAYHTTTCRSEKRERLMVLKGWELKGIIEERIHTVFRCFYSIFLSHDSLTRLSVFLRCQIQSSMVLDFPIQTNVLSSQCGFGQNIMRAEI